MERLRYSNQQIISHVTAGNTAAKCVREQRQSSS